LADNVKIPDAENDLLQSLKKSYAILQGVIESSKDVVIFALDCKYQYLTFNRSHQQTMKRIWGVDIALGNNMLDYIENPDDRLKAKTNFDRALSGESFTLEEEYGSTELERRYYKDIYNPIIDENGKIFGLTLFLTDITERRKTEEALRNSEFKHKALVKNIPGMVYRAYPDWSSEIISGSKKISGYTSSEISAKEKNWLSIIHPEDIKRVFTKGSVLTKEEIDLVQTYRIITKNGDIRWVEDRKTSFFSEKGEFLGIDGVLFNITGRKKVEDAFRASEERFKFLAENMGDVVWTVDLDFKTTYISPSVEKVLGYTPDERKKQKIEEMITPESLELIGTILVKEIELDKLPDVDPDRSITMEVEYYHCNGTTIWMENKIKAIRDEEGQVVGIYGVSRDITDRKMAQDALIREKEKLQDAINKIRQLSGMLPICSRCKKIRDDQGYWNQIESYIRDHSEADFSHSICPECAKKLYPDLNLKKD